MAVVPPSVCDRLPVRRRIAFAPLRGQKHERRPQAAIGQRYACSGGGPARRGHAGDDRERDIRVAQRVHLFARATEDRAVATFQPDDGLPRCPVLTQAAIDFLLCHLPLAVPFSDAFDARGRRNQLEDFLCQQVVVQHDVSLSQHAQRFQREQLGIARPGANEVHHPDST